MSFNDDVFRTLSTEQSLAYLEDVQPGRIVMRRKEDIEIFPINFVVDGESLYFRTAEGSKLFTLSLNHDVLFEADGLVDGTAWSVIIKGTAEVLQNQEDIDHAETLELKPWAPTLKYNWVRINAEDISGREFEVGEEPERY
ncbi:MAG: pyridoxamine 5'-phosphate oxidase family protein [Corynebacterium sp.]|uniref:pyridoxamine 5'-phosphate oxidase family protein n=1 Tax=Corynebacterium sp. TaxID=1720 RepID=UPI0026E0CBE6|nr:pyridoxamine 5'-phosphate oxidase family protein [Corynebacterium sp.]MDO5671189.1 pyridoxamine 5'-phosphate oxidase family protein [Corynebacterium sp.]